MQQIKIMRDVNGSEIPAVYQAAHVDAAVLATSVASSHTVPAGAETLLITATADVWIAFDATAAAPVGAITSGLGPILIPSGVSRLFPIPRVTAISLVTDAAAGGVACLEFFA
jgi:stage V sporulation protein SpoVS